MIMTVLCVNLQDSKDGLKTYIADKRQEIRVATTARCNISITTGTNYSLKSLVQVITRLLTKLIRLSREAVQAYYLNKFGGLMRLTMNKLLMIWF